MNCKILFSLFLLGVTLKRVHSAELTSVVTTKNGPIQGLVEKIGSTGQVNFYQGIQFGHAKRFEKSTPIVKSWTETYHATTPKHACIEAHDSGANEIEDCLFLNIWQPVESKENRSVLVWIHGGGLLGGNGLSYHGGHLAHEGDLVVVAINYRLGALGYLYLGGEHHEANLGFYDQVLALKWVQENIHSFGGNPHQVTVGESAGSWSVSALILSPVAKGLFRRAVMESGAMYPVIYRSISQAENLTEQYAHQFGCTLGPDMVKCLQAVPLEKIKASKVSIRHPVYGTEFLPTRPPEALLEGKFNRDLDLMFGAADNENTVAHGGDYPTPDNVHNLDDLKKELSKLTHIVTKAIPEEIVDFYLKRLPAEPTLEDMKIVAARAASEFAFECPTVLFGEHVARFATAHQRFYSYRFMQSHSSAAAPWLQVPHGSINGYLFPSEASKPNELSANMIRAWSDFAKTGVITKFNGTVEWPEAFTDKAKPVTQYMNLKIGDYKVVKDHYEQACDTFWKPRIFA